MMTHIFLFVTPTDYSLDYVASIQNTIEGTKTAAQYASVTLEAITIELNAECCKLLSMRLTKLNVASFWICTLQVAEYTIDQIDLNDT